MLRIFTPTLLASTFLPFVLAACGDDAASSNDPGQASGGSGNGTSSGGTGGSNAGGSGNGASGGSGNTGTGGGSGGSIPIGDAPLWFANAPEGEWIAVAADPSETIASVVPNPPPKVPGFPGGPGGITSAWTGGGVDQERGELMLIANGGHADYEGNEGYAISLREETPAWRRLNDPTPSDQLEIGPASPIGAVNADGRPRAMHSTFECFGDGRMWYAYQNSYVSGAGDSTSACFSFDRGHPGIPDVGGSPLAWTADDLGPWEFFPNPNANWTNGFGKAAWDPVGHKVWAVGGNNNINYPQYWSVETAGPNIGKSQLYTYGGTLDNFNGWIAIAYDLRILVAAGTYNQSVYVLSLDQAGNDGDWQKVSSTGSGWYESGSGGAYVIANHSIAVGNPKSTGKSIHKLQIPTKTVDGKVVYDASGEWSWTELTPGGANVSAPNNGGNNDANSKWNIVENMGNGLSALVVVTDIQGPVYVYKIPQAGL